MTDSTLESISRELQLIRRAIRRSRLQNVALAGALGLSVTIGVITVVDDDNDDRRERENLAFVLEARCEAHNRERRQDAEVLIAAASDGTAPDPNEQAAIDEYRRMLERTATDCEAEVDSLLP